MVDLDALRDELAEVMASHADSFGGGRGRGRRGHRAGLTFGSVSAR